MRILCVFKSLCLDHLITDLYKEKKNASGVSVFICLKFMFWAYSLFPFMVFVCFSYIRHEFVYVSKFKHVTRFHNLSLVCTEESCLMYWMNIWLVIQRIHKSRYISCLLLKIDLRRVFKY